jgi:hypothetical protein
VGHTFYQFGYSWDLCKCSLLGFSQNRQSVLKTLRFSSTPGNSPVVFNSNATSFMLTGAKAEAGLAIGALEDNDDSDDTATR